MANVSFYRGSHASLLSLSSYVDGRFYLTTDTDRLFVAQGPDELVELNKSITVVDNISDLPEYPTTTTSTIKGAEVEEGQFYYVKAGGNSVSGNILAVHCGVDQTTGKINWVQVNPDTDTTVSAFSIARDTVHESADEILFSYSLTQDNGKSGFSGSFSVPIADILSKAEVNVALSASLSSSTLTLNNAGLGGDSSATVNLVAGENVTFSKSGSNFVVSAVDEDTQYQIASPSVAGASSASSAVVNLNTSGTGGTTIGSIAFKAGEDLAIDNTVEDEITIFHKNSGVSAGSYGLSAAATPAAGSTFSVPYVTVDAQGHVTSAATNTITLPADEDTYPTAITLNNKGDVIITGNNSLSVASASAIYYDIYKDGASTATRVYNQGELGSFYTASKVDSLISEKMQGLNAVTYKGTVFGTGATEASLPTSSVSTGDAYLVASTTTVGTGNNAVTYNEGDLVIATGTEGNDGYISTGLSWTRVPSGDDIDTTYAFSVANNTISATPYAGNVAGTTETVAIISGGTALTASTAGSTITINHDAVLGSSKSAGPSANVTGLAAGDSFSVPYVVADAQGHITTLSGYSVTLPGDEDTKYTMSVSAGTPAIALSAVGDAEAARVAFSAGTALSVTATSNNITYSHANVSKTSTVPAANASGTALAAEGTIDIVTSVTSNDQGHVTGITVSRYVLPEDTNTEYTLTASGGSAPVITLSETGTGGTAVGNVAFSTSSLQLSASNNNIAIDLVWGTF